MPGSLDALRDIHLPEAVSWWPLAIGYWLLLALMLVALLWWFKRYRLYTIRRAAQKELDRVVARFGGDNNSHALARQVNVWLRRAVLSLEPRHEVASLTGSEWINHVQSCSMDTGFTFSDDVVELLTKGVYQASTEVDAERLIKECRAWARLLPPRAAT